MSDRVNVFYAEIPSVIGNYAIFPLRQEEVNAATNPKVKLEKYWSWVLLERIFEQIGLNVAELHPCRGTDKKWRFDGVHASISHSHGVTSVAISNINCGVDLQQRSDESFNLNLAERILTKNELLTYSNKKEEDKSAYLLEAWTKKESIFKMADSALAFNEIECEAFNTFTAKLQLFGKEYCLSVAASGSFDVVVKKLKL